MPRLGGRNTHCIWMVSINLRWQFSNFYVVHIFLFLQYHVILCIIMIIMYDCILHVIPALFNLWFEYSQICWREDCPLAKLYVCCSHRIAGNCRVPKEPLNPSLPTKLERQRRMKTKTKRRVYQMNNQSLEKRFLLMQVIVKRLLTFRGRGLILSAMDCQTWLLLRFSRLQTLILHLTSGHVIHTGWYCVAKIVELDVTELFQHYTWIRICCKFTGISLLHTTLLIVCLKCKITSPDLTTFFTSMLYIYIEGTSFWLN